MTRASVVPIHALGLGDESDVLAAHQDRPALRYIENKPLDMDAVASWLEHSRSVNHWTNFGPVSALFEQSVAELVDLDPGLRVVACSNATVALHALTEMHATKRGEDLRWAVSAFGYYSTIDGPLRTQAEIVDCDEAAMLDLDAVDPKRVDGLIVTNIFGQRGDLSAYREFARAHEKILVVDAAVALGSHAHGRDEVISFHHTKPWGFGEGGVAIVAEEDELLFRSLVIFGHAPGQKINRRAVNGKISDPSAAFKLMRLEQMRVLRAGYRAQYERILELGSLAGLEPVPGAETHPGTPASVPLLLPTPGPWEHPHVPLRRYYHPLDETSPQAWRLFERIVNVPCHVDMARLEDSAIVSAFADLIARSRGE